MHTNNNKLIYQERASMMAAHAMDDGKSTVSYVFAVNFRLVR